MAKNNKDRTDDPSKDEKLESGATEGATLSAGTALSDPPDNALVGASSDPLDDDSDRNDKDPRAVPTTLEEALRDAPPVLLNTINSLVARMNAAESKLLSAPVTSAGPDIANVQLQREALQDALAKKIETDLLAGEFRFQCGILHNPTKIVGAKHEGEAMDKYMQYMGIRASPHDRIVHRLS